MAKDKDAPEGDAEEGGKKGGKMKLILIIAPIVLLLVGGGLYFFVFSGSSETSTSASAEEGAESEEGEEATEEGEEGEGEEGGESEASPSSTFVAGEMVAVEAVTINLAAGHYLKVGLAMQATADAGEEVTAGKAIDAMITQFSGKTVDELATAEGREESKKELLKVIKKAYEKKVYEIYYTSFVMN